MNRLFLYPKSIGNQFSSIFSRKSSDHLWKRFQRLLIPISEQNIIIYTTFKHSHVTTKMTTMTSSIDRISRWSMIASCVLSNRRMYHKFNIVGGCRRRGCRRVVYSAKAGSSEEPEGWITSVECLRAPSGWCSRFGAAAVAGGAEAAAGGGRAGAGREAGAAEVARAQARPDCATTTAVTSSTRSRWLAPPSGAARAFPPPPHPATVAASSTGAGKRCTA